jgi:hypothetical protein
VAELEEKKGPLYAKDLQKERLALFDCLDVFQSRVRQPGEPLPASLAQVTDLTHGKLIATLHELLAPFGVEMSVYANRAKASDIKTHVGTIEGCLKEYLSNHRFWDDKSKEKIVSAMVPVNQVETFLSLAEATQKFMVQFDDVSRVLASAIDKAIRAVLGLRPRGQDDDDLR